MLKSFADAFEMAFDINKCKMQMIKTPFQTVILKHGIIIADVKIDCTATAVEKAMINV